MKRRGEQSQKIRECLAQGMRPKDIAVQLGIGRQSIYDLVWRDKQKAKVLALKTQKPAGGLIYIGDPRPSLWTRIKLFFTGGRA